MVVPWGDELERLEKAAWQLFKALHSICSPSSHELAERIRTFNARPAWESHLEALLRNSMEYSAAFKPFSGVIPNLHQGKTVWCMGLAEPTGCELLSSVARKISKRLDPYVFTENGRVMWGDVEAVRFAVSQLPYEEKEWINVRVELKRELRDLKNAMDLPSGGGKGGDEKTDTFEFRRDGDGFVIGGFGERGHLKFTKGLWYIYQLIRQPGVPIPMADLVADTPENAAKLRSWSKQPTLDSEALNELRNEIAEVKRDQERAQREYNSVEEAHCLEEIARLEAQLRKAMGLGGKLRDLNQNDRLRPTIHKALKTAYKNLQGARPSLSEVADHFEASISSESGAFVYRPAEPAPAWEL